MPTPLPAPTVFDMEAKNPDAVIRVAEFPAENVSSGYGPMDDLHIDRARVQAKRVQEEEAASDTVWRENIEALYRMKNPMRLDKVPELIQKSKDKGEPLRILYVKVCKTYGVDPKVPWATQKDVVVGT